MSSSISALLIFVYLALGIAEAATTLPYHEEWGYKDDGHLKTPTEDPFYQPPEGYEDAPLGHVFRYRMLPRPPTIMLSEVNVKHAWHLLYRTQDQFQDPAVTVLTVMVPFNANYSRVVSYLTAEDSGNRDCAFSYGVMKGSAPRASMSQFELIGMSAFLDNGYIVTSPDYQEYNSGFSVGKQSGWATLDGVRAAIDSEDITGISSDAEAAFMGYSGGALACGWAVELQPEYYPEITSVGAVAGGYCPNITSLTMNVRGGWSGGLVANGMTGLANVYPEIEELMDRSLYPATRDEFYEAGQRCLTDALVMSAYKNYLSYFRQGPRILEYPLVRDILEENNLGKTVPQIPLMIYHSQADDVSPFDHVQKVIDFYCENEDETGVSLEFHVDKINTHATLMGTGVPAALKWVMDRFDGVPPVQGCYRKNKLHTLLDPDVRDMINPMFKNLIMDLVGEEVGPGRDVEPGLDWVWDKLNSE